MGILLHFAHKDLHLLNIASITNLLKDMREAGILHQDKEVIKVTNKVMVEEEGLERNIMIFVEGGMSQDNVGRRIKLHVVTVEVTILPKIVDSLTR